jgi:uncharacterized protein (TIGR03437 family)
MRPLAIALIVCAGPLLAQQETALDRYVRAADPAFGWELRSTHPGLGFRTFNLRMTSQTWLTGAEVSGNRWQHWLRVIVPSNVQSAKAVLLINGGNTDEPNPGAAPVEFGTAVALTGTVLAELRAVPNQPLTFAGETASRSEDAILAFTWDKYLRTGDERWPAQLPMTKAAVRAMDAVIEFCATAEAGGHRIDGFVVGGGSKRGWTSWLTAAVDRRVIGLAPLVFDALNAEPAFRGHFQTYGFWSSAVADYERLGIFAWLGSAPSRALMRIVDPYEYRSRLTMPKYIINAAGDQFFPPTSSQLYFGDLAGSNSLRYVPNVGHELEGAETETLSSAIAWAQAVIRGSPVPQYSWQIPEEGRIVVNAGSQPTLVRLWQAANTAARDFRRETIGTGWTSSVLLPSSGGVYQATVERPQQGWKAFFVELNYPSSILLPLVFTTPVQVIPGTLPFRPPVASVLAASFHPLTAAGAIVSGFGEGFAPGVDVAVSLPLPTELAGTGIRIVDARGVSRMAGLFFVSPGQMNYLVPPESSTGVAKMEVLRGGQKASEGQLLIERSAPGLFSANGNGRGVAAGIAITVRPDGTQIAQIIFNTTQPEGSRAAVPVVIGEGQVFLSLFGTGMRNVSSATARVGGEPVGVAGPVPSGEFAGVEQINLGPLPGSLAGRGEVDVNIVADGNAANVVTVRFQ